MTRTARILIFVATALASSGCSMLQSHEESFQPPLPVMVEHAPASDGSIYRENTDVRLFEDMKASRVGDILTVKLIENTNASKSSQTSTSKTTEASLPSPTIAGISPVTYDGNSILENSLSGETTFDGAGSSSQSNSLVGDITVTVVDRLPNGNLVIRGEKWVTLNQGREFIRLSGIVRPRDIGTDNTLVSTRIANAQIAYSSKGVMAAANRQGWLSRFFNSVFYPH